MKTIIFRTKLNPSFEYKGTYSDDGIPSMHCGTLEELKQIIERSFAYAKNGHLTWKHTEIFKGCFYEFYWAGNILRIYQPGSGVEEFYRLSHLEDIIKDYENKIKTNFPKGSYEILQEKYPTLQSKLIFDETKIFID